MQEFGRDPIKWKVNTSLVPTSTVLDMPKKYQAGITRRRVDSVFYARFGNANPKPPVIEWGKYMCILSICSSIYLVIASRGKQREVNISAWGKIEKREIL